MKSWKEFLARMFRSRVSCLIAFGCFIIFLASNCTTALAEEVLINNPSFEEDVPEDGGWMSSGGGAGINNAGFVTGWELPGGWGGSFRPTTIPYPEGIPDGLNVCWLNGPRLSQVLSQTLSGGFRYTLQVHVGKRADLRFSSFSIQLLAGENLLAQTSLPTPGDGHFTIATVTYTATPGDSFEGLPLKIRLLGGGTQVNFDMVTLDASPECVGGPCAPCD